MIFHVTSKEEWSLQKDFEAFSNRGLQTIGFIHACEEHQVAGVLSRYFAGQKELVRLHIDQSKLKSKVVYEPGPTGELFPHIYGPINREAVVGETEIL